MNKKNITAKATITREREKKKMPSPFHNNTIRGIIHTRTYKAGIRSTTVAASPDRKLL